MPPKKEVLKERLRTWTENNSVAPFVNAVSFSSSQKDKLNVGETVETLKVRLKALGAKSVGKKDVLQKRVTLWSENNLDRTLFEVVTVPALDSSNFPMGNYQSLEKLQNDPLKWLSIKAINLYFDERMAGKGNEKGRKLFLCEFLKNCTFYKNGNDIYFRGICSAEMKKNKDYEVKVHINCHQREIMKAQCQCPAGNGFSAACKHVSALIYGIEYYAVTGRVKENVSCTSTLQQWHQPSQCGRNLIKTDVNEMLNIDSPIIQPSVEITDFVVDAFSKGIIK